MKYVLAAAGLAAILSSGCANTTEGGYYGKPGGVGENSIIYKPGAAFGDNSSTCRDLGKLLNSQFDDFRCFEVCGEENEKKKCEQWDLIIRGYVEQNGVNWPVWGVNIPNVCHAYSQGRWAWELFAGRDVYLETKDGGVTPTPYGMSHNVAKKLTAFMGIRAQMNQNCENSAWRKIMEKHGPTNKFKK